MQHARNYLRYSRADQLRILEAAVAVVSIRLGLWLLPLRVLQRWTSGRRLAASAPVDVERASRLAWSVRLTSGFVPGASCLTQALATQLLLRRRGIRVDILIGVAKDTAGKLQAHAWIEYGDIVIIGGAPVVVSAFKVIHSLG